jgi:uncharacterized protein
MANFLHGIETINIQTGTRPVTEVKTAVIGLVGIAPTEFGQNTTELILNDVQAAQYGKKIPGFNIPQALDQIFAQNAGTVIVINVFDEATHTTAVALEEKTVVDGKLKLGFAPIGAVVVKTQAGEATAYVIGTDYTLDAFGNFEAVPGKIANGTVLKFDYKKLNAAAVINAHIIGTVDGAGNRTGIKALDLAFSKFGFSPKILIAPGYSAIAAISQELISTAQTLKAVTFIDSTVGWTPTEAIEARGEASQFFTGDKRAIPCYPYLKAYDEATNADQIFPFSAFAAGVMAATDNEFGYWYSPSNKEIQGVTGIERPISSGLSDVNSEANLLNGAGIYTVFNNFGTGYRTWGNRNASYPTNTAKDNFISVLRTADVVEESLQLAALQFVDRPINQALIDDIRESGNAFIRTLIGRGALYEGSKVVFDKADNPTVDLAAGNVKFRIIFDAPAPAERITFYSMIDISLSQTLR